MLRTTSFSAAGQEQGIHQYIPPDLRRMFYKNPAAIHASHNGLDPYGFPIRGLILYLPLWALNNGGTNSIQSVDAYRHTGVIIGALWIPNGRDFDGDDDRMDFGDAASLKLTGDLSYDIWLNPDVDETSSPLSMHYSDGYGFAMLETDRDFRCYRNGIGLDTSDTVWSVGSWVHLGYTNEGTRAYTYVNGAQDTTKADTTAPAFGQGAGEKLNVGCRDTGTPALHFNGQIGELRIYNRALSAGEMGSIYNATKWRY